MDMELETLRNLSPRAISPLTGIVDSQETRADVAVKARKRIPTEKSRQFEIQKLKESRKTSNLTKQINVILPLLADFENEKQVRIEVVQLDQLFVKMHEVHDMYLSALDDESEVELARQWYDTRYKDVPRSKQKISDYLHDAKKLHNGLHDTNSVTSLKGTHSSSLSTKLRLIEEQNIDVMNDYLEGVKAKLTVTPFLSEAKPDDQTTLRVPFGSTVATTPPLTAPTFVSTASVNPAARPSLESKVYNSSELLYFFGSVH